MLNRLTDVSSRLALVRKRLAKVLATGGSVISVIQPYEGVVYYAGDIPVPKFVLAHNWQPVKLTLLDEPGDTLSDVDAEFSSYFRNVKKWSKVFERPTDLADLENEVLNRGASEAPLVMTETLAKDRQGNAVGLVIWAGYPASGIKVSGPFIAFVPPTEIDDEAAIRLMLSELHGIGTVAQPPDWLYRFQAPGELEAAARVGAALKDVEAAKAELSESEKELRTAREPLQILYEQHSALQGRCEDVFQRMGISTKPSTVSDEFMLTVDDRQLLVEVKGRIKSSSQSDVSQLLKDVSTFFAKQGQAIKGVLVANSWIKLPPDEREPPDHRNFPPNVIEFASEQHIALLDTRELYKAYQANQRGDLSGSDFLDILLSTDGPVKISQDANIGAA